MEEKKEQQGTYELDLTWEELEAQAEVNEQKNNPILPRPKKFV